MRRLESRRISDLRCFDTLDTAIALLAETIKGFDDRFYGGTVPPAVEAYRQQQQAEQCHQPTYSS